MSYCIRRFFETESTLHIGSGKGYCLIIAIVFTHSYPYNYHAEHVFVGRELPSLVKQIDKVILVPRRCKGEQLAVPPGADVENGYADFL